MKINVVRLNEGHGVVDGLDAEVSLSEFRKQLKDKKFTELTTVYKSGTHEVKYITEDYSRAKLLVLGLVAPTKAEKRELAQK